MADLPMPTDDEQFFVCWQSSESVGTEIYFVLVGPRGADRDSLVREYKATHVTPPFWPAWFVPAEEFLDWLLARPGWRRVPQEQWADWYW